MIFLTVIDYIRAGKPPSWAGLGHLMDVEDIGMNISIRDDNPTEIATIEKATVYKIEFLMPPAQGFVLPTYDQVLHLNENGWTRMGDNGFELFRHFPQFSLIRNTENQGNFLGVDDEENYYELTDDRSWKPVFIDPTSRN